MTALNLEKVKALELEKVRLLELEKVTLLELEAVRRAIKQAERETKLRIDRGRDIFRRFLSGSTVLATLAFTTVFLAREQSTFYWITGALMASMIVLFIFSIRRLWRLHPKFGGTVKRNSRALKSQWQFGVLDWFRCFCGKENRVHLELIHVDLLALGKEMRRDGFSRRKIGQALAWHVFNAIGAIAWDGAKRRVAVFFGIADLINKFRNM